MDSLQEILGAKKFVPPDEMTAIKDYVSRKYKSTCSVKVDKNTIVVRVPSPTLAAAIHLERQELIKACGIKKQLFVRAGR